jgi:hypothetical protein
MQGIRREKRLSEAILEEIGLYLNTRISRAYPDEYKDELRTAILMCNEGANIGAFRALMRCHEIRKDIGIEVHNE